MKHTLRYFYLDTKWNKKYTQAKYITCRRQKCPGLNANEIQMAYDLSITKCPQW